MQVLKRNLGWIGVSIGAAAVSIWYFTRTISNNIEIPQVAPNIQEQVVVLRQKTQPLLKRQSQKDIFCDLFETVYPPDIKKQQPKKQQVVKNPTTALRDLSQTQITLHTVAIMQKIEAKNLKIVKVISLDRLFSGVKVYRVENNADRNQKFDVKIEENKPQSVQMLATGLLLPINETGCEGIINTRVYVD